MRVLVIFVLVLTALYVWPGFAVPPAPEPLPPKRVFAAKPAPKPAEAPDPNPECRWSQAMRADMSVRCHGEPEPLPRPIAQPTPEPISDFPTIDVEAACREAYGSGGNSSVASCLRREQPAYDFAAYAWAQVPAQARDRCRSVAGKQAGPSSMGPHVFYSILSNCLGGELTAEQNRQDAASPPRFRY